MSAATITPPTARPPRRVARWIGLAVALVALLCAVGAYVWGIFAAKAEAAQRAKNSFTIPGLNASMVWIAPGSFLMGTPEQNVLVKWFYAAREKLGMKPNSDHIMRLEHEGPATWVTLTQPFWLGRTAVTQRQYEQVMGTNPSEFRGAELPVEQVSWDDAMAFCQKLTEQEQAAGRLPTGYAFTLPTEAQREYACRAGTTGDYAGDLDAIAWYGANSGGTTHPVGTKVPNAWGLHDMEGNVWEWCRDWFGDYPGGKMTNPQGPSSGYGRIMRGGGWFNVAVDCRAAIRAIESPDFSGGSFGMVMFENPATPHLPLGPPGGSGGVGFRVALSPIVNPNDFARNYPYDAAEIRQHPEEAAGYSSRGVDREAMADYEGAISDYLQAIKLAKDEAAYERFYLLLILRRLHRPEDPAGLAGAMTGWPTGWPAKVGRYLTGGMTETDFLAATVPGDARTAREQHCEAYYYIGMTHLLAGDTTAAKSFFVQCLSTQMTSFHEYELAQAELGQLSAVK